MSLCPTCSRAEEYSWKPAPVLTMTDKVQQFLDLAPAVAELLREYKAELDRIEELELQVKYLEREAAMP